MLSALSVLRSLESLSLLGVPLSLLVSDVTPQSQPLSVKSVTARACDEVTEASGLWVLLPFMVKLEFGGRYPIAVPLSVRARLLRLTIFPSVILSSDVCEVCILLERWMTTHSPLENLRNLVHLRLTVWQEFARSDSGLGLLGRTKNQVRRNDGDRDFFFAPCSRNYGERSRVSNLSVVKLRKTMDEKQEDTITPWNVALATKSASAQVDYEKLVNQFGCQSIGPLREDALLAPHRFFRRGLVFAHRDFDKALARLKTGEPVYLYTGRGPSSRSMHLGHAVPFLLTKFLQDTFGCTVVIQLTDDEKFLWKDMSLEQAVEFGRENAKDIMALGFDPTKTFIFSNVESAHQFIQTTLQIEKCLSLNDVMKVFGFTLQSRLGQVAFPAKQLAPCFASAFPALLTPQTICLVPSSVDQDPYFRLARDVAGQLGQPKPASLYCSFVPALQGLQAKMSASAEKSAIFLSDSDEVLWRKLRSAFSGGRESVAEHRQHGGDPECDVAFQLLRVFLEDDLELEDYKVRFESGAMLASELKRACFEVLRAFLETFRARRAALTAEDIALFYNPVKISVK